VKELPIAPTNVQCLALQCILSFTISSVLGIVMRGNAGCRKEDCGEETGILQAAQTLHVERDLGSKPEYICLDKATVGVDCEFGRAVRQSSMG
jgi:hypothetical protein